MPDPIRDVDGSPLIDAYGHRLYIGTDHGCVTIRASSPITLTPGQRDQLDRMLYDADQQAAAYIAAPVPPTLLSELRQEVAVSP